MENSPGYTGSVNNRKEERGAAISYLWLENFKTWGIFRHQRSVGIELEAAMAGMIIGGGRGKQRIAGNSLYV